MEPEEKAKMSGIPKPGEFSEDNIQEVTEDQLKSEDKAEFDRYMEEYKKLCLSSYGCTKNGAIKKASLPRPRNVTIHTDSGKLQE